MWCTVRALKWYLDRTKTLRRSDQLFVICKEPHSPASKDSVSRWIVRAIKAAGPEAIIQGATPHAHDTRSISTSWALFNGVSLDEIMRAAYWQSKNSFMAYYLRDVPAAETSFSHVALYSALRSSEPIS